MGFGYRLLSITLCTIISSVDEALKEYLTFLGATLSAWSPVECLAGLLIHET